MGGTNFKLDAVKSVRPRQRNEEKESWAEALYILRS